jgi:hypothetical protein
MINLPNFDGFTSPNAGKLTEAATTPSQSMRDALSFRPMIGPQSLAS